MVSKDNQIYVYNNLAETIYVLPTPNKDWVWADVAFGIVSTVAITAVTAGLAAPAASAAAAEAVNSVTTLSKLITAMKSIYALYRAGKQVYQYYEIGEDAYAKAQEASNNAKKFLDGNALKISPGTSVKVYSTGGGWYPLWVPTRYLSPSGWATAFNGSDMSLFIATTSLSKMVSFDTNSDASWIVNKDEVVRARYGNISVEDRGAGYYRIPVSDRLFANQSLLPGQSISSPNGDYDFVYQPDGNAVVYKRDKPTGETPIWSSKTKGKSAGKVSIQEDGNFVVYDASDKPAAATNIYGNTDAFKGRTLVMQDDGNLVVYDKDGKAVWDTLHNNKFDVYP